MAVQSDTSRISYTGNNSTVTTYAVPFVFLENAHLSAIAKDTATGAETTVTLTNHTGAGDPNGGTVRTAVAVPATSTLTISRTVPATQTTSYQEGGDFPAASHERALDKLTMAVQQVARSIARTVRLSDAAPESSALPVLPNRFFGTDGSGNVALLQGTDTPAGSLTDVNIAANAAIALSKLATGALPSGITVADANVASGAAIALSKLATGALPTAITVAEANLVSNAVSYAKLAAAVQQMLVTTGAVLPFAVSSPPTGWLAADGSELSKTGAYADLFAVIGTSFGETNGSGGAGTSHFRLPDLRGIFVRGSGSQTISGTTFSATFADKQTDLFKAHTHSTGQSLIGTAGTISFTSGPFNVQTATNSTGGSETRPANIALLYCIKF